MMLVMRFWIDQTLIHNFSYFFINSLDNLVPLFLQYLLLQSYSQIFLLILTDHPLLFLYNFSHLPHLFLHFENKFFKLLITFLMSSRNKTKFMIFLLHFDAFLLKGVLSVLMLIILLSLSQNLNQLFLLVNQFLVSIQLLKQLLNILFAFFEQRFSLSMLELLQKVITTLIHFKFIS